MSKLLQKVFKFQTFKYNPSLGCNKFSSAIKKTEEDFIPIYQFQYVKPLSVVNRLKLYQTALAGFTIPGSLLLNQFNFIEFDTVLFATYLGVTGCMVLYTAGYICNKFVGFIYLHKNEETVKIAYIDFWGKRKDEIVPINDIIPISDLSFSITDSLFLKLKRYSTQDMFKMNVGLGQILHKEYFKKVFAV